MRHFFRTATILALALGASTSALAQEAPSASELFAVGQGRARLLSMPSDIAFFSASPRGALRVRVVNARTLAVSGRAQGPTRLVIHLAPRANSRAQEARLVAIEVRPAQSTAPVGWSSPGAVAAGALPLHTLSLRVAGTQAPAQVWAVDGLPGLTFASLSAPSLREWVASLPEGAAIRWAWPSKMLPNSAPRAARELKDFAEFCQSEGVQLEGEPLEARQRLEPRLFSPDER